MLSYSPGDIGVRTSVHGNELRESGNDPKWRGVPSDTPLSHPSRDASVAQSIPVIPLAASPTKATPLVAPQTLDLQLSTALPFSSSESNLSIKPTVGLAPISTPHMNALQSSSSSTVRSVPSPQKIPVLSSASSAANAQSAPPTCIPAPPPTAALAMPSPGTPLVSQLLPLATSHANIPSSSVSVTSTSTPSLSTPHPQASVSQPYRGSVLQGIQIATVGGAQSIGLGVVQTTSIGPSIGGNVSIVGHGGVQSTSLGVVKSGGRIHSRRGRKRKADGSMNGEPPVKAPRGCGRGRGRGRGRGGKVPGGGNQVSLASSPKGPQVIKMTPFDVPMATSTAGILPLEQPRQTQSNGAVVGGSGNPDTSYTHIASTTLEALPHHETKEDMKQEVPSVPLQSTHLLPPQSPGSTSLTQPSTTVPPMEAGVQPLPQSTSSVIVGSSDLLASSSSKQGIHGGAGTRRGGRGGRRGGTIKSVDNGDKQGQLLSKGPKIDRGKKRAEMKHLHMTVLAQRKVALRQRKEREKMIMKQAKERQEKLAKQREAEEREIRKHHIAAQKEVDNRRRAEERRLRMLAQLHQQEVDHDRRLYQYQLDQEKAEQLKRPTEDLQVRERSHLPALPRMNRVRLPPKSFADLLMVVEFCYSFGDFMELDCTFSLPELYADLYNTGSGNGSVFLHCCARMLGAVCSDLGTRMLTMCGVPASEVELKDDTLSEVLRLYMMENASAVLPEVCSALSTLPVQCLRPSEKVDVLAFLIDNLLTSKSLCREIDSRMERVSKFRREKWKVNMKLKRFHSKLMSISDTNKRKLVMYSGRGRPPKQAQNATNVKNSQKQDDRSSADDDGGDGDTGEVDNASQSSNHEHNSDPECSDEATDEDIPSDKNELQRRIRELRKKQTIVRAQIHRHMKMIRKFPLGQDRYARQYWLLPQLGCIVLEGVETSLGQHLQLSKEGASCVSSSKGCTDTKAMATEQPDKGTDLQSQQGDAKQEDSGLDPEGTRTHKGKPGNNDSESCSNNHAALPLTSPPRPPVSPPPPRSLADTGAVHPQVSDAPHVRNHISPSLHAATSHRWFSLFPRTCCDSIATPLAHVPPAVAMVVAPQPQQQYILSNSFGPSAYTYIASGGAVLAQPIGMGYGLVGNAILPQAQYIAVNSSSPVQYIVGGGSQQDVQYIAFGGENQVMAVMPPKATESTGMLVQPHVETSPSPSSKDQSGGGTTGNAAPAAVQEVTPTASQGEAASSSSLVGADPHQQQQPTDSMAVQSAKEPGSAVTGATPPIMAPVSDDSAGATPSCYSILLQVGNEGQYITVPADPRVLSGQCSYVMVQQPDGSQQLALLENYSTPVDPQSAAGVIVQPCPSSPPLEEAQVMMECPSASLASNEAEGDPYCVEIVLLYVEHTREATPPVPKPRIEEKDQGKSLLQLLDTVDKDHTHGWWYISEPLLLEKLLRGLCLRGYREKALHKIIHKSKDQVLTSLNPTIMQVWEEFVSGDISTEKEASRKKREGSVVEDSSSQQPADLTEKNDSNSDSPDATITNPASQRESENDQGACSNGGDDQSGGHEGLVASEDANSSVSMEVDCVGGNERAGPSHAKEAQGEGESARVPLNGVVNRPPVILSQSHLLNLPAPEMNVKVIEQVRERIEGMVQRLCIAKLQAKDHFKQVTNEPEESLKADQDPLSELKSRLLRLEQQVDRKYLKPPLGDEIEGSNQHSKKVTMDTPPTETMLTWRSAVQSSSSASQIAVCVNVLDQSISWEKSTSKVFCQACRRGDNESLLLLCDGCDKGTHTYCCVPPLDSIPDGDWYCYHCAQATHRGSCFGCDVMIGTLLLCAGCPKAYHKRCVHPPLQKSLSGPWYCPHCQKAKPKPTKKMKASETKQQTLKDEMALCFALLDALEENEDAWPFLEPVEKKAFPEYFKVIKKPMDFQTVRNKLEDKKYSNKEGFAADVRLIFDNCKLYNEDDSEIGIAGQSMKMFFEKQWSELMGKQ